MEVMFQNIKNALELYFKHGARSSRKVDALHAGIAEQIKSAMDKIKPSHEMQVKLEQNVKSSNAAGKKKCDIVVVNASGEVAAVFPVKFIITNYNQNKNNSFENLTGELFHLRAACPGLLIIPINIIFNEVPYLDNRGQIKKFEKIHYESSYKISESLSLWGLSNDIINIIIDVKHECGIDEKYDRPPEFIGFNEHTPFRSFEDVLRPFMTKKKIILKE